MTTSVVDLGQEGSDAAVERSGPAENPGQDATESADNPAENPCLMTQLRQRWLLALVRGQRGGAFNALVQQASEQFCLERIESLVKKGLWHDALEYLNSFLPACPRSLSAQIFHNFLLMHHYIARLADGDQDALDIILADKWMSHVAYATPTANPHRPASGAMVPYVLFMDTVRKRMDWVAVRKYVADCLYILARRTPELDGRLALPGCPKMQHDVLPALLGLSPTRRRMKKQGPRVNPAAVARAIKGSRRYIRRLKQSTFETFDEAKEWLSKIIDGSLRYGMPIRDYLPPLSGKEEEDRMCTKGTTHDTNATGVNMMLGPKEENTAGFAILRRSAE